MLSGMPEARCEAAWPHHTIGCELVCLTDASEDLPDHASGDISMVAQGPCRPGMSIACDTPSVDLEQIAPARALSMKMACPWSRSQRQHCVIRSHDGPFTRELLQMPHQRRDHTWWVHTILYPWRIKVESVLGMKMADGV
jgi:hypothetical protein